MEIVKKDLKDLNLNKKALKDFNVNIPNKKPFKIENIKSWFAGQKVHVIFKEYESLKEIPKDLDGTAALGVVDLLDRAWKTHGEVSEGMIGDLIVGCVKDKERKMSPQQAAHSIRDLREKGYIHFSDDEGNLGELAWTNLSIDKIWFRLTDKFLKLIVATKI